MLSVTWALGPPMEMKVAPGDLVNDLTRDDCRGTACRTLLPSWEWRGPRVRQAVPLRSFRACITFDGVSHGPAAHPR